MTQVQTLTTEQVLDQVALQALMQQPAGEVGACRWFALAGESWQLAQLQQQTGCQTCRTLDALRAALSQRATYVVIPADAGITKAAAEQLCRSTTHEAWLFWMQ